MATKKALAATGAEVNKSVTITINESTLEAFNAAATAVGAPAGAAVAVGGAPYMPPADGNPDNYFPYQITFTWSEAV